MRWWTAVDQRERGYLHFGACKANSDIEFGRHLWRVEHEVGAFGTEGRAHFIWLSATALCGTSGDAKDKPGGACGSLEQVVFRKLRVQRAPADAKQARRDGTVVPGLPQGGRQRCAFALTPQLAEVEQAAVLGRLRRREGLPV
jgi:hypothetical protein